MKLPLPWLLDYLDLKRDALSDALRAACARWDLAPHDDAAHTFASLFTFAGFACEGIEGLGLDAVLELEVLANRPDAQCVVGLAREMAAVLRAPFNPPACGITESGPAATAGAQVVLEEPALCPRYTARIIRGVRVGPSPDWLQSRLRAMGLVPRNNIVDVTNYVLFEMNQPLHAFDLNKLAGRKIVVRRARPGEPFQALYGEVPPLTPETLVIADAERAVAVGGIIGGMGTEVTAASTEILLEAAYFDPPSTRRTSRRLKVSTDSSYRFERGIDLEGVPEASARAARLIVETAGGAVAPGIIDCWPQPRPPREVTLRHRRLEALFGAPIPLAEARAHLESLGCAVAAEGPSELRVRVPSWRRGDLEREVDLIEEVARLHGYNHAPARTAMRARIPPRSRLEIAADRMRALFSSLGYFECVTDSLTDPRWPTAAVWTERQPLALDPRSVLREDHSVLRTSLLTSLLSVQRLNQDRRAGPARIFECGRVYLPRSGSAQPEERPAAGLLDEHGFAALADALRRLPEALEAPGARIELEQCAGSQAPAFLAPEAACRVLLVQREDAPRHAGWLGLAAGQLCKAFDLRRAPAVAELDMSLLAGCPPSPPAFRPLPIQPEVVRDVALVVDEAVAWGEIERFAAECGKREPLRDAQAPPRFLSAYRGKQIGAGKKSVAFSIVYRAPDRSLTDEEVNTAHGKFVEALLKEFNATLRA